VSLPAQTAGTGPDLVLLHGWGMNAGVWQPVIEGLAARHRVTALELPGHGASAFDPARGTLRHWAAACLDAAPSRAIWLGWSLGAQVALQAALDTPERVRGLVAVAGTPRFVQDEDWPHAMPDATFRQFAAALASDHAGTLDRFLGLQVRGGTEARETLRELRAAIRARPAPQLGALRAGLELLLGVDLRADLPGLQPPSLWLFGERDTLVPADVVHPLETLVPSAEILILHGAAHAPFLSSPGLFLELLGRFLDTVGE
jgi:pimeloyl-[acyl-carrier protein] methyl ester esterase